MRLEGGREKREVRVIHGGNSYPVTFLFLRSYLAAVLGAFFERVCSFDVCETKIPL